MIGEVTRSQDKVIQEKHVNLLFGTTVKYALDRADTAEAQLELIPACGLPG